MKKIIVTIILITILVTSPILSISALEINNEMSFEKPESTASSSNGPYDCYTLVNPWFGKNPYLIDNNGTIVHMWHSNFRGSSPAYLLENGNLIRSSAMFIHPFDWHNGSGGRVEMFDWDGNLIWNFEYISDDYVLHNDIEVLSNGNILMTVWNYKTKNDAITAGINPNIPDLDKYKIRTDYIIEVEPTFPEGGNIVWEWHVWNHLIQDIDPSKDNYGVVADHPELLDINYEDRFKSWFDLIHINSVEYIEEFDQILISGRQMSEIWVIDHNTTTEEAAGHTGGNYGKGGDILYRWGNPQIHNAGNATDQKLFMQHDAGWIEEGFPGEGHITIYNNGCERPDGKYSSVMEIDPPVDDNGNYSLKSGSAYGPEEALWIYTPEKNTFFYSGQLSGAQRLPNGNTRICRGRWGHLLEVTHDNEIVWEYINPYPIRFPYLNEVFKTQSYPKDYPCLNNINTSCKSIGRTFRFPFIERLFSFPIFSKLRNLN